MLRLAAFYVLANALMVVFSGVLRGAGGTFWAMCISVAMHWLLLPALYLALKVFRLPPQTAWLALIFLFLTFSAVFCLRYRAGHWKALRVVGGEMGWKCCSRRNKYGGWLPRPALGGTRGRRPRSAAIIGETMPIGKLSPKEYAENLLLIGNIHVPPTD
jgi:hypothetical protein